MRLIAHNMLKSNIKGVDNGYPLGIDMEGIEIKEREFDPELVIKLLSKIEYMVLKEAIDALGLDPLPPLTKEDLNYLIINAEEAFDNEEEDDDDDDAMEIGGEDGEGEGEQEDMEGETDMEGQQGQHSTSTSTSTSVTNSTSSNESGSRIKISKAINTEKKIRIVLHKMHHALLEIHITQGALICPETGRRFPIKNGIPNMLLHEDEV